MARRSKILGLPIGKKKSLISAKAWAAGAGIAAIPAAVGARKLGGIVSNGRQELAKVSDLTGKAKDMADAVSDHSSTLGKVGAVIGEVRKLGGDGGSGAPKLSHLIEEHVEVAVPRKVAYNQWTQFETFPAITKGAERVEQQERDKVAWTSKIGPSRRSWQGEITEQVPDERIAWKSTGGLQLKGVVTFHSLDDDLTRVLVQIEYDPKGPVETVGNLLRVQRRRVRRDLRLFKHFLELRGEETGAWRSRIAKKDETKGEGRGEEKSPGKRAVSAGKRTARTAAKATSSRSTGGSGSRSQKSSGASRKASGNRQQAKQKSTSGSGGKARSANQSRRSA